MNTLLIYIVMDKGGEREKTQAALPMGPTWAPVRFSWAQLGMLLGYIINGNLEILLPSRLR